MTTTERLYARVDASWLAAFRVLYGLVMAWSMLRFLGFGWVDKLFVEPGFHFKYWGFAWVPAPGPVLAHALFWTLAALALCVAAGLFFRITTTLFVVGFVWLQLVDVTTYLNHYYLAALLGGLLASSPAGRSWSLDARRTTGRWAGEPEVPALWLWTFRFQLGVVYTFAGLAKAGGDWLFHAQPLGIWLSARTDTPLLGPILAQPWAPMAMSWAGFLFDTTIVVWLLWRRTRPFAFLVLVGFHVVTRALFPIGMFPVIMILGALVFFEPDWPRRLLGRRPPAPSEPAAGPASPPRHARVAVAALAAYAAVQLLLPLRHWAYAGDVLWDEQGMRFSWRVMVREKNGAISFRVVDPATGRRWEVSPRRYLTALQEREMSSQPDLILQLAHHVRDDFAARGFPGVAVYADTPVSLNGRRATPLVDPGVDLAHVSDGLGGYAWVAPPPGGPPPRLRAVPARQARR